MTAAHKPRAALEVVTDPEGNIAADAQADGEQQWRAQTVIDQYSAEHQFVGSLMWLTAEQVRPLLELVPDTAIWRPRTRWAYELIRQLVDADTDPTPVSVLAAGRGQPARDAIDPDSPPSAGQLRQLALYLFDAYAQAVAPTAAIGVYAREVLDQAYRRAFDACGIRMQQLAACGADREVICRKDSALSHLALEWIVEPYAKTETRTVNGTTR